MLKLKHKLFKWIDDIPVESGTLSIKEFILEKILFFFCIIGFFAVLIGGYEVYLQEKANVSLVYISAYLPILACFIFRSKIPFNVKINIVLLDLYLLALLILYGVGLSGAGIVLLVTFCVLTTVFQGAIKGLISILISVAAIVLIGWAMSNGLLPIDIVAITNSTRLEAWFMAAILFVLICTIMVLCISLLQNSLERTINIVQNKKSELRKSNEQLEGILEKYKDTEKELLKSKSLLESALEATDDSILIVDRNRQWTGFNQNFINLWNIPKELTITGDSKKAIDYVLAGVKNTEMFIAKVNELYENEMHESFDIIELKNGKIIERYSKPQLLQNEVVGRVWSFRDVTERRKFETQLQKAQKLETIGTLAGGIAHDFNNILFPILGYSEMLLDDTPASNPGISSIKAIYSSASRAKELVQQILTFSRQEQSELRLMKIQPILNEAIKMIRSTIPTTIDIHEIIDKECGPVKADPTQIHQVIMNLATNAHHAMEENGGVLTVYLKEIEVRESDLANIDLKPANYAYLSVKDTGIGMPDDLIEKIFDPFFTTKESGKGTGLGLSVVHGIINKMGGDIQITSKPGKGTEFKLYFPIETVTFQEESFQTRSPIPRGSESILLVDDEIPIITMEKQLLERLGYKVTSRSSSIEALEVFRANPAKFDLIITDFAMPVNQRAIMTPL